MPSVITQSIKPSKELEDLQSDLVQNNKEAKELKLQAEKDRSEAFERYKKAKDKLIEADKLLKKRKDYVKNTLDAQIHFCRKKNSKLYYVTVSWFDHFLKRRIVISKPDSFILPFNLWCKKHKNIETFYYTGSLRTGATTLLQSVELGLKPVEIIVQLLSAIGIYPEGITTLEQLYSKILTLSCFIKAG